MRNKTAYWHAVGVLCVIVELLQQEENKPQQGNTFKLGEMVQDLFLKEKPVNRISENHRQNLCKLCRYSFK